MGRRAFPLVVVLALALPGCGLTVAAVHPSRRPRSHRPDGVTTPPSHGKLTGIHKIRHVVVIMQENRSFDSYFGTYPGADGIPMRHGVPTVRAPNPKTGVCVKPFHDSSDVNQGGPHEAGAAAGDINGGRLDGFTREAE